MDGELTLNENVADLGAIKAIVATRARMDRESPAANLPGLNYTEYNLLEFAEDNINWIIQLNN